jgi:stearoyl-CoA desaturase (delta-9 desaturase)
MKTNPTIQHNASDTEAIPHDIRVSLRLKLVNLAAVVLPFIGLVAAIVLLWGIAFNWVHLVILAVMYIATGLGITIGYHRLFTHGSFKTSRVVTAILAVLGSMAVEGPLLHWVATHRKHHQHSDHEDDPHSPHIHGTGLWSMIRGLYHAHVGWIFRANPRSLARYTGDLRKDKMLQWVSRLFPLWVLVGLLIPALLGGLLTMSWTGVLLGFIWGGLVRIFLVHHVTWSINSVCHIWGSRPYDCHDESRNNVVFGVLAFGEGWHNNHHAFPTSARHGLRWWQIDTSYLIIWVMSKIGLARDVRIPSKDRITARRYA